MAPMVGGTAGVESESKFTIRIGRKAMTLGGDSSKAAIARSSDLQVWFDSFCITHVADGGSVCITHVVDL